MRARARPSSCRRAFCARVGGGGEGSAGGGGGRWVQFGREQRFVTDEQMDVSGSNMFAALFRPPSRKQLQRLQLRWDHHLRLLLYSLVPPGLLWIWLTLKEREFNNDAELQRKLGVIGFNTIFQHTDEKNSDDESLDDKSGDKGRDADATVLKRDANYRQNAYGAGNELDPSMRLLRLEQRVTSYNAAITRLRERAQRSDERTERDASAVSQLELELHELKAKIRALEQSREEQRNAGESESSGGAITRIRDAIRWITPDDVVDEDAPRSPKPSSHSGEPQQRQSSLTGSKVADDQKHSAADTQKSAVSADTRAAILHKSDDAGNEASAAAHVPPAETGAKRDAAQNKFQAQVAVDDEALERVERAVAATELRAIARELRDPRILYELWKRWRSEK